MPESIVAIKAGVGNGDDLADLLVVSTSARAQLFVQQPSGDFSLSAELELPGIASEVAFGDLNGDGLSDLAYLSQPGARCSIALGWGGGFFESRACGLSADPLAMRLVGLAIGDLPSDRRPDLLVSKSGSLPALEVLAGGAGEHDDDAGQVDQHDWRLGQGVRYPLMGWSAILFVADVTDDGRDDVLLHENDGLHVMVQAPSGTLEHQGVLRGVGQIGHRQSVATGDFNGDGVTDIAVAARSGLMLLYGKP